MKLVTFTQDSRTRIGVVIGSNDRVVDLSAAAPDLPKEMVAFLEAGDVIPTGTSSGVGIAMKPPKLLVEGDVVRIAIEGVGEIENGVIAEPEGTPRIVRR